MAEQHGAAEFAAWGDDLAQSLGELTLREASGADAARVWRGPATLSDHEWEIAIEEDGPAARVTLRLVDAGGVRGEAIFTYADGEVEISTAGVWPVEAVADLLLTTMPATIWELDQEA